MPHTISAGTTAASHFNRSDIPVSGSSGNPNSAVIDSTMPIAVGFGILGATFGRIDTILVPGLRFAAKKVLRAGIVVLGFRLSFNEIRTLGLPALSAVVVVVIATFFWVLPVSFTAIGVTLTVIA